MSCKALVLPKLHRRVAERAPGVRLAVQPLTEPERVEALAAGRLDMIVSIAAAAPAPDLREEALFSDHFVCVARRQGGRPTRLTTAAFAKRGHVVVAPHGQPGSIADEALALHGIRRNVVLVVPSFAAALLVVAQSDLVATVPSRVVATWPRGVAPTPCPIPLPTLRFCAYTHRRVDGDGGLAWFRRQVRDALDDGSAPAPSPD